MGKVVIVFFNIVIKKVVGVKLGVYFNFVNFWDYEGVFYGLVI